MSILKREALYGVTNGLARFSDWALVTTTLGAMAEPFTPNRRHDFNNYQDFDATDEIARIDCIRAIDMDREPHYLSGGVDALIGGHQMPRVGR